MIVLVVLLQLGCASINSECKVQIEVGAPAPFRGVLLTDALALGIARDIAVLEAAVEERGRLLDLARGEHDACAGDLDVMAGALRATAARPSRWWVVAVGAGALAVGVLVGLAM